MDTAKLLASVPTGLWIGVRNAGTSTFDVLNPATGRSSAVADATAADGIAALDAAAAVKGTGGDPARDRGEILRSVFETIIARTEDIATLMTPRWARCWPRAAGGQVRRRVLPVVRRGGGAHRRPLHPRPGRHRPDPGHQVPSGAMLCDHAVELSAGDGYLQDRSGGEAAGCTMIVKPAQETH